MASGWHNKVARLSRAGWDWDEVRTRVAHQLRKQNDVLRHRLGIRPEAIQLREFTAPAGKFFFSGGEAAERADLSRKYLPEQAAEIVREADEICLHRFRLLGYENLDYGREIDWHLDLVHNKRAPLEPWCKVPFLEFAAVGDHKVTWELNRHQHLVTLAKAWLLTKDEKYVRELMAQWGSWIKSNPYPVGINWGSSLEVAFRTLSWIWVDQLLATAPHYPEFRAELLPALAFHGRYIERYLSTYFSPNTHLLGEVLALFFLGTLYPQMPHALRWRDDGWKILLHEAARQVRPDGVYFEQSLYYHVYALDFFIHARVLAAANDVAIPASYDAILARMLNVVEALAQAGPAEGFGDDDGGRLFNGRRNRTEHMTDPLALGAVMYDRDDLSAAQLTEESIWLFGERASTRLAPAKRKTQESACSLAFPDGGLYILSGPACNSSGALRADSADSQPRAHAMVIDAGPQGEGRCGHGHADALSVRLTMNGSRWLVDSGSGVYISADPADRNSFRGTAAHNTLRVDGLDQAVAGEPFSWTQIPTTQVEDWIVGRTFTYFAGSHNGYARVADPVTHRRCVLHLTDGIWLVRDVVLGSAEHALELRWHFASDVSVQAAGAGEFIASRAEAPEPFALRMILPEDSRCKTQLARSIVSPAYGQYQPVHEIQSDTRVKLPAEIATALIAQYGAAQTRGATRMVNRHDSAVQVYELQEGDRSHEFFFSLDKQALDKQTWNFGFWSSDAALLYCKIEEEKLVQLIMVGGKSVAWQGQPLLNARRPCRFFEWRKHGAVLAEPESMETSPLFDELTGGSQACSNSFNATSSYAEKH